MWKKIKVFLKRLFYRSERVEIAVSLAKGLKLFSDSSVDDILYFILRLAVPSSSTAVTLIQKFLKDDLPVLLKALQLIDESDETKIKETNINAVTTQIKKFGTIVDENTLKLAIEKCMKDDKLTLAEAKDLLTDYITIK